MNFWLTVLTGISDPKLCLVFGAHSLHAVMCILTHWIHHNKHMRELAIQDSTPGRHHLSRSIDDRFLQHGYGGTSHQTLAFLFVPRPKCVLLSDVVGEIFASRRAIPENSSALVFPAALAFIIPMLSFCLELSRGPKPSDWTFPLCTPLLHACTPRATHCIRGERGLPSAHSPCCRPQSQTRSSMTRGLRTDMWRSTYCPNTMDTKFRPRILILTDLSSFTFFHPGSSNFLCFLRPS